MHDERLTKAEDREVVLAGFLQFVAKIENKPGAIKIIQSMAEIHPEWKNVIELVLAVM
jgi:hypothetical protein